MDRKRSQKRNKALSDWENQAKFTSDDQIENNKQLNFIPLPDRDSSNGALNHQVTLFQEIFGFECPQSNWFHFNHGLLWGGIIGLIALFSASCGVALTRIDAVENSIARMINHDSARSKLESHHGLAHPINILLMEVEDSKSEITDFSTSLVGKSKTILLLQLNPQSQAAKIINIPVDSKVQIPGFGWGTMIDANWYGGTFLVSQVISKQFDGIKIDRYVRATPMTFSKLIASGRIALNKCDAYLKDCSDIQEQIASQKIAAETIRQRLNIPTYLTSFQSVFQQTKSDLDTNLSLAEVMSVANFIKELDADSLQVNLVPGYIQTAQTKSEGEPNASDFREFNSQSNASRLDSDRSFKNRPIAIQNTTDSPELGRRFLDYLRHKKFQDVYLVEHIPLKLAQTRIVLNQGQLARAKYLKNTIGFGRLESKSASQPIPLTIQIGEDGHYLPLDHFSN